MQTANENRTQYFSFDSVEELLNATGDGASARVLRSIDKSCVSPTRSHFIGRTFSDWAEVYGAARTAWDEGLATLESMVQELGAVAMPKPKSRKRRPRFDEAAGDDIDYDRLRAGQDFWRLTRRESSDAPATLTLFVQVSTSAHRDASTILWRGAAAIVLTKLLEDAGYRVELWAVEKTHGCYSARSNWPHQCTGVCLKRTGDPLDTSTLINAVSGWFFRTMFFRAKCLSPYVVEGGLGSPEVPTTGDLDQFSTDARRHLVAEIWDRDAAIKLIRTKLAELAG